MLKKILKEATRIEQWQQEIYTALHNIDAAWVTTGTFDVARIPNLDASKITSGVFDVARIPGLDASKIISGTFDVARIPGLDASKIVSGTFDVARIPNLDASKITSGIFDLARIPNIDWSRISANFPRTIAELLSDHDLTHHPLSILPRMDLAHMPLGASGYFLKGQGTADPVYALLTATDIPSLDASKITSGRFVLARLPTSATANRFLVVRTANADPVYDALLAADIPSLDASKITSGTFDVARIPNLDASKITSGTFALDRIPRLDLTKMPLGSSGYFLKGQGTADPIYALLTAADIPALDASKITTGTFDVARIPDLDASKIISGIFDEARIPHTFNLDVAFNSRGLGSGLRLLYVGDETEKSVYGTGETEIKTFRMIYDTSHGRKFARIYFVGEAYVTGGTGYLNVSIDGAASQTVWTITATSYALHEGYIDVSWTDDTVHTISIRLVNSGSYYTYNRTLEVYVA
jgi:hypothetical protein